MSLTKKIKKDFRSLYGLIFILLAGLRLFFNVLIPLTDKTEARYGEVARLMAETGNWIVPQIDYGIPFWAKPPLSTWLSAGSISLFGGSEFGLRLPYWILAILIAFLMIPYGHKKKINGLIPGIILFTIPEFFLHAGVLSTDMMLSFSLAITMMGFCEFFHSEKNLKRLKKVKKRIGDNNIIEDKIGTVGAVALDKNGNIAAATSTGGMTNKMPGRVGDTPIIGSGTWAQNNVCGVSSTGHGEFFIKYQVAKEVCTRIEYLNETLEKASSDIIEELLKIDARGGIIAIDKDANTSMPFNTDGMIRGSVTNKSELFVAIY